MNLSEDDLKKVELTVDDGRLDCGKNSRGRYSCAEIKPVKKITGVCVDDQTNVGLTGRVAVPTSFENDDWDTIIEAINSGTHPYSVGDTKEVDMGKEFETHTVRLANLTPCDGTLESETACGVVLEFADIITTYKMNDTRWNKGGWPATKLRTYLNNNIYNELPSELKNIIIDTKVVSGHGFTPGEINFVSVDKLYLLSTAEVWQGGHVLDTAISSTRQLDYYKGLGVTTSNYSGALKQYNGSNSLWWLRTANSSFTVYFYQVSDSGDPRTYEANSIFGVSPAFRIA